MSKRHHDHLMLERSARKMRKLEKRRLRHEIRQSLHTLDDPDAVVIDDPKSDRVPTVAPARPRRLRHWKVKDWKRRNLRRHQRNQLADAIAAGDE